MMLPWQAWGELGQLKARWYIVIPVMLNITCAYLLFRYGLSGYLIAQVTTFIDGRIPPAWDWIVVGISRMLDIAAFVFVTFLAVRIGTIIGSPFYAIIAERFDRQYLAYDDTPQMSFVWSIITAVWFEIRKIGLLVVIWVIGVLIQFVPVIGSLIGVLWVLAGSGFTTLLDYTDASMGRRNMTLRERVALFWAHLPEVIGFALAVTPFVSFPVINIFSIPLFVCAGIGLYVHHLASGPRTTTVNVVID
jgi:CysZ protein